MGLPCAATTAQPPRCLEPCSFVVLFHTEVDFQVDEFLEGRAKGKTIIGCYSIQEMVENLAKPCRIQLMVKAGEVVDQFIEQVLPHLTAGDIIIDGGNR
jgi:6-phosphogluconate dehydrogenase